MQQQLILTADGSHTVVNAALNVSYHSKHGAIRESQHIFIDAGLKQIKKNNISILEIGFGTGLNALLTLIAAEHDHHSEILYEGVELYPLDGVCVSALNYLSLLKAEQLRKEFELMHSSSCGELVRISDRFQLKKICADIRVVELPGRYDLIYFDAFDPMVQPELWADEIFRKIYDVTNEGGVLVTYSSKSIVRRAMERVGFKVKKIQGPPGKREIVMAIK